MPGVLTGSAAPQAPRLQGGSPRPSSQKRLREREGPETITSICGETLLCGRPRWGQCPPCPPPVPHPQTCACSSEVAPRTAAGQLLPALPAGSRLCRPARAERAARSQAAAPASCPTSSLRLGPVARGRPSEDSRLIISSFLGQLQTLLPAQCPAPRCQGGGQGTPRLPPRPQDWGSQPAARPSCQPQPCSLFLLH